MAVTFMQWLGAGAVVFGSALFGRKRAATYRARPRELRRLAALLRALKADITYARVPLVEALARTGRQVDERTALSRFFADSAHHLAVPGMTAQAAWGRALADYEKNSALSAEDREVLAALGKTMGVTGPEEQVGHLDAALALLEARECEAIEDRERYERVYQTIGILTGALIVILLI